MTVREMQVLFENLIGQYNKEMPDRFNTNQIELILNHSQNKILNREFVEKVQNDAISIRKKLTKFRKLTQVVKNEVELKFMTISGITGTFEVGEIITEATSGATGKIVELDGTTLYISNQTGTFTGSLTITGGTSGATATSGTTSSANYTGIPNSKFFSLVNISNYMYYVMSTSNVDRTDKPTSGFVIDNVLTDVENLKDFINNDFNKPYLPSPIVGVLEDGIVVVHDSETTINNIDLYYLRQPKKMTSYTITDVYANYTNTCELPEEYHEAIVQDAVKTAIFIKEPAKYEITINENAENNRI